MLRFYLDRHQRQWVTIAVTETLTVAEAKETIHKKRLIHDTSCEILCDGKYIYICMIENSSFKNFCNY